MEVALYIWRRTKRGQYRLYSCVSQAVTAWKGSNDKITVVREDGFLGRQILEWGTLEELQVYCKEKFNTSAYEE